MNQSAPAWMYSRPSSGTLIFANAYAIDGTPIFTVSGAFSTSGFCPGLRSTRLVSRTVFSRAGISNAGKSRSPTLIFFGISLRSLPFSGAMSGGSGPKTCQLPGQAMSFNAPACSALSTATG